MLLQLIASTEPRGVHGDGHGATGEQRDRAAGEQRRREHERRPAPTCGAACRRDALDNRESRTIIVLMAGGGGGNQIR